MPPVLKRSNSLDSLEREAGRRRARQEHKKSRNFYAERGVTATEEYFINSRGVELFTKQWLPLRSAATAVVFYCHGFGGSCTHVFEDVAVRLAAAQMAVVSLDYEGHGLSAGLHGYIRSFNLLVDDVVEYSNALRSRSEFTGLPFFLYGESMGGAVAIQVHRRQKQSWAGAILVAPMCKISDKFMPPKPIMVALRVLARIVPTWKAVPTKDVSDEGYRVPHKREVVRRNPVGYNDRPRVRTATEMLGITLDIRAHMDEIVLPLLVLHGEADTVTDPKHSMELVKRSLSSDKTLRLYQNAWHGLTSAEPDEVTERVITDIIEWIRKHNGGEGKTQERLQRQKPQVKERVGEITECRTTSSSTSVTRSLSDTQDEGSSGSGSA